MSARCSDCKHMYEDAGRGAYSEYTGPEPPEISCLRGRWAFDFADARKSLRVIADIGRTCPDFEDSL